MILNSGEMTTMLTKAAKARSYSSDFPHEVNTHTVQKEIRELRENEKISASAKEATLYANAARFYGLKH